MDNDLLTTIEAARYLTLKKNTLEIWRVQGKGPRFLKFGRSVRYRKSDCNSWITGRERRNTSKK